MTASNRVVTTNPVLFLNKSVNKKTEVAVRTAQRSGNQNPLKIDSIQAKRKRTSKYTKEKSK